MPKRIMLNRVYLEEVTNQSVFCYWYMTIWGANVKSSCDKIWPYLFVPCRYFLQHYIISIYIYIYIYILKIQHWNCLTAVRLT